MFQTKSYWIRYAYLNISTFKQRCKSLSKGHDREILDNRIQSKLTGKDGIGIPILSVFRAKDSLDLKKTSDSRLDQSVEGCVTGHRQDGRRVGGKVDERQKGKKPSPFDLASVVNLGESINGAFLVSELSKGKEGKTMSLRSGRFGQERVLRSLHEMLDLVDDVVQAL